MTARRRTTSHHAWLAALAELVDAIPPESVAVVALRGDGSVGMAASLDRRACLMPEIAASFAGSVVTHCRARRFRRCAIVSFTDARVDWECAAGELVREGLEGLLEVEDSLVVSAGRYRSPSCADPHCCPPGGRRLPAARDTSQTSRARDEDERAHRTSARRAGARSRRKRELDASVWREEAHALWRAALADSADATDAWGAADGLAPPVVGRLGDALTDSAVRDALILEVFGAGATAVRETLAGVQSDDTDACLDGVMRGDARPSPRSVEAFDAVLMRIEDLCRGRSGAEASAVRALLSWWWGDLASCLASAQAAIRRDDECRLAALLCETATRGLLPGWLREVG